MCILLLALECIQIPYKKAYDISHCSFMKFRGGDGQHKALVSQFSCKL